MIIRKNNAHLEGHTMKKITLKEWNQRQPKARSMEQVRRWVRAGKIYPPPILDGREYLVDETAIKITPNQRIDSFYNTLPSLTKRIQHGRKETNP